ncbi:MAG: HAD-IIA family hydrolase [Actinobacteria bacterium]|nr:HAD-IIA family hydrolase [Actinomycetota bacterium]
MSTGASAVPLTARYDVALLDLDGVVYVGSEAVPGAVAALEKAAEAGLRRAFVTNNASRSAEEVATLLRGLGVHTCAEEVVTSAQAAAHLLADRLPAGALVLVVGSAALAEEVRVRELVVTGSADDRPVAVVQGYSPDVGWRQLAEATIAVRRGALWVATNIDATIPSPRGPLPGNGSLVGVVRSATGATPLVTGKPQPELHQESVQRTGARRPLIVGDRLDTDIEGATGAGVDSMLVLTGVTTAAALLAAGPRHRPTYLAADLSGLLVPHPVATPDGEGWRCGGFVAVPHGGQLTLAGAGPDHVDALRALCAAAWRPGAEPVRRVAPAGAAAAAVVARLGLAGPGPDEVHGR